MEDEDAVEDEDAAEDNDVAEDEDAVEDKNVDEEEEGEEEDEEEDKNASSEGFIKLPVKIKLTKGGKIVEVPKSLRGKFKVSILIQTDWGASAFHIQVAYNQLTGKEVIKYLMKHLFMEEERAGCSRLGKR